MERLRVLTLNIWNRQGPWEARRDVIQAGLVAEAADVIGLQEVLRLRQEPGPSGRVAPGDQAQELSAGLGYEVAYGPAWELVNAGPAAGLDLGNAVLSRFPILESACLPLPNPAGNEGRSLLYALIDTPAGRLPFFTTHLTWQLDLGHVRCQQLRFIADRIAERTQATAPDLLPAVLTGDLNAEPESAEVRFLRGWHPLPAQGGDAVATSVFFHDCYALAGPADLGATFCRDNPYAAREREPDRRIDYIFSGGPDRRLRGEPLAARRCFMEPGPDGVYASDHYGVVADIQVGPREKERH